MSKENETTETQEATVSEDQMEKALADLQEAARGPEDEKQDLLSKALAGDISDEENTRLASLLSGEAPSEEAEESLAKSVTEDLDPEKSEEISKAIEVGPFLKAQHEGVVGGLAKVAEAIEKSQNSDNEFRMLLAKSIVALGDEIKKQTAKLEAQDEVIKSLGEEVSKYGETVPGGPRAVVSEGSLEKSFAGTAGGDTLSKSELAGRLSQMATDAYEKGEEAHANSLFLAASTVEAGGNCPEALMQEVTEYKR